MGVKMIKRILKKIIFRRKWRKANKDNFTYAKNIFPIDCVEVGKGTYGGINVLNNIPSRKLKIGAYCSIAEEVLFILGADHALDNVSTYPFKYRIIKNADYEAVSKGDIIVDDDVWIGQRTTIMSGVHIRQGAVIAAGAVVTKDVPAYSIVGGIPAKVIRYRFSDDIIHELLKLDLRKLTDDVIKEYEDCFYEKITSLNVENIVAKLNTTQLEENKK